MKQQRGHFVPPLRDGVGASRIGLPPGPWPTMMDFLVERFAAIGAERWQARLLRGDVIDEHGVSVTPERRYQPQLCLYYYRDVPDETPIPFQEDILYQDADLLVVDKPHFLPVVPSGGYLRETLLVRLKRRLGLEALVPLHRIDRDTAGLVMFSLRPESRAAYYRLFRERLLEKTYEAVAPWRDGLKLPLRRESRIVEAAHFMLQHEVEGPVNAVTELDLIERHGALARYRLRPVTGQRHQLRVHMAALGIPILGDGLYPTLQPEGQIDDTRPLQLLAKSLRFTDPLSGQQHFFESRRHLNGAWCSPASAVGDRGAISAAP